MEAREKIYDFMVLGLSVLEDVGLLPFPEMGDEEPGLGSHFVHLV